jgi:hypothetical protein
VFPRLQIHISNLYLAQKAASAAPAKKGWGLGGWFGGGKKETQQESHPNKPIKAKLGEESSFYYDPDLKRWINKKAGKDDQSAAPSSAPPPPRNMPPRSAPGTPPTGGPPRPNIPPATASAPPQSGRSQFGAPPPQGEPLKPLGSLGPTPMNRSASNGSVTGPGSAPPSRPGTGMSNASSIDDLLGPPTARKGTAKKPKKGRGYIDVMGDKAGA